MKNYKWSVARMSDWSNDIVESVKREAARYGIDPRKVDNKRGEFVAGVVCRRLLREGGIPDGEMVLGVGFVYPKDTVVQECQQGSSLNVYDEFVDNGFIEYQCDGLVTVNWDKVYDFVDELAAR